MAVAVVVLLALVALAWVALALSPAHRATFSTLLSADTPVGEGAPPPVTAVVPARNEAGALPLTGPTLCRQDYPDLRVVVVDDQSEDDTPEVVRRLAADHPNLAVVRAPPRPAGWFGKPWAVAQGVAAAPPTDWLLFTDADVEFHPRAVRQAMTFALEYDFDALSLIPQMVFGSTAERVALAGLVTALTLVFPVGRANDPESPAALAAGAFILVRRSVYEKIGGHAAVRSEMIDDINLARKLKAAGARFHVRLTPDLVSTRMYEGWADLWEGLAKNAYAGLEYKPLNFWAGLLGGVLLAVLPPAYLAGGVGWLALAPASRLAWVGVALSVLINVVQALVHRRAVRHLRLPAAHTFLMPASAALYLLIATWSAWEHHVRGGNVWKGRRYGREMMVARD